MNLLKNWTLINNQLPLTSFIIALISLKDAIKILTLWLNHVFLSSQICLISKSQGFSTVNECTLNKSGVPILEKLKATNQKVSGLFSMIMETIWKVNLLMADAKEEADILSKMEVISKEILETM